MTFAMRHPPVNRQLKLQQLAHQIGVREKELITVVMKVRHGVIPGSPHGRRKEAILTLYKREVRLCAAW